MTGSAAMAATAQGLSPAGRDQPGQVAAGQPLGAGGYAP